MISLLSQEEMRVCEAFTMQKIGVPSMVLMERAALAVVDAIKKQKKKDRILVVAGSGNNGGDAFAVARILLERYHNKECRVDVCFLGKMENCTSENIEQQKIFCAYGGEMMTTFPEEEYDIIVDGIFGIGLSRTVTGIYAQTIEQMNQSGAYKIAIDIPSGIHTDTGKILGCAFCADETICFAFGKRGLFFYPGTEYAGKIKICDVGIGNQGLAENRSRMYTLTGPVSKYRPKRAADGNKGTFGKLLVIAGSEGMSGACQLCVKAAYRMGSGMVKAVVPEVIRQDLQGNIPEALCMTYPKDSDFAIASEEYDKLAASMEWADAIVAGPGLGTSKTAERLLELVLSESRLPLVLDADALNLLAKKPNFLKWINQCHEDKQERIMVLTPHMGEMARMCAAKVSSIQDDVAAFTEEKAGTWSEMLGESWKLTLVLKDARTLVYEKEKPLFLNTAGNSGMATAGSGDVLSGMIGALLAEGLSGYESGVLGVYAHACAGDKAVKNGNEYAIMANDIADEVRKLR